MFDWEELRRANHIIEQLRATSGTNDKIDILSANKDNILLSKVLYYTYDGRWANLKVQSSMKIKYKGDW